jgi:type I restriction enzyme, S subunit
MNQGSTTTNFQLKKGYKQTEVGIIPEDWDLLPCSDISNLITVGIVIRPTQYYEREGISALRSANIREAGINDSEMVFISEKANIQLAKSQVREGDVLTVRTGYPGTSAVVTSKWAGSNCIDILITRPSKLINSEYLVAWINSSFGKYQVLRDQGGLAQQHFNVGDLRNLLVAVPPILEQEAIACTLSDIDATIESLDRLLTKKRQIKQGAMQELLRSKDGYIEYPFSSVCWFQEGPGVRNYQFTATGVKLFNGTNIEKGKIDLDKTNRYISEREAFGWYSHFLADAGDIVIACSGISIDKFDEKVAVIDAQHLPLCMNTSTMRFKVRQELLDKYYLLHFLRSSSFKVQIGGTATGSAQLNFGPSHVSVVKIQLPNLSEQIEIANILSDMDAEIGSISAKLAKTRQLKQGMMHELLTGRIRLVG